MREAFKSYKPLPLGTKGATEVVYEGRHLITDEVVEQMKVSLPLLQNGLTAISFYVRELEAACKVQSTHPVLAPLLQDFLGEVLFGEKISLTDNRLTARLSDQDVREHIRAVFLPLIRARTVKTEKRRAGSAAIMLRQWKPVTLSENRPAEKAAKTLFNLVPCNRQLEVAMSSFLDKAPDVAAFAKNAGPQCLRIDYLTPDQRLAFYTPDFFVRGDDGSYFMVETKGRQDRDVPRKAQAAVEWCKAASKGKEKWEYVFTPENIMQSATSNKFAELARACVPALKNLLSETTAQPELPLFGDTNKDEAAKFYPDGVLDKLGVRGKKAALDAYDLFLFLEKKEGTPSMAPVFNTLLGPYDEAAKAIILKLLQPQVPVNRQEQDNFFSPHMGGVDHCTIKHYEDMARKLKRALIHGSVHSAIGLLRSCYDHALNDQSKLDGIFEAVKKSFTMPGAKKILERVSAVNEFRNTYVAHHEKELTDRKVAEENLRIWVETLTLLRV